MSLFRRNLSSSEVTANAKKELCGRFGDELQSLIHFGNHVDPSLASSPDDKIQLLIVFKEINEQTFQHLSQAYQSIRGVEQIAPMVMTLAEIRASTDVFPTTFLEMKHHHQLLFGEDVLESLVIETPYLRIRCEQELKNLLLRLQAGLLANYGNTKQLKGLLHHSIQTFLRTLHGVQVLFDQPFDQERGKVIEQACENLSLNKEQMLKLAELDQQHDELSRDALQSTLVSLIDVIAAAAVAVDQLANPVEVLEVFEE